MSLTGSDIQIWRNYVASVLENMFKASAAISSNKITIIIAETCNACCQDIWLLKLWATCFRLSIKVILFKCIFMKDEISIPWICKQSFWEWSRYIIISSRLKTTCHTLSYLPLRKRHNASLLLGSSLYHEAWGFDSFHSWTFEFWER